MRRALRLQLGDTERRTRIACGAARHVHDENPNTEVPYGVPSRSHLTLVTDPLAAEVEAADVHDLLDRMLDATHQAARDVLDAYEQTLDTMLDLGQGLARTWQPEGIGGWAAVHLDLVRILLDGVTGLQRRGS